MRYSSGSLSGGEVAGHPQDARPLRPGSDLGVAAAATAGSVLDVDGEHVVPGLGPQAVELDQSVERVAIHAARLALNTTASSTSTPSRTLSDLLRLAWSDTTPILKTYRLDAA